MNSSRRSFLRMGSMLGLTALASGSLASVALGHQHDKGEWLGTGLGFRIPKSVSKDPLSQLSRLAFEKCVGSKFTFSLQGRQLTQMTLSGVQDFDKLSGTTQVVNPNNCFLLVFSGPASPALQQGTYSLQNQWIGGFQLFIVPGASTSSTREYGAVINRL